jgi:lysozyme
LSYIDLVTAQLKIDEGVRLKPYVDSAGKFTIGCGRNLTDDGISDAEMEVLLANDVNDAAVVAASTFNFDATISDERKAALCNLAFNLGEHTLSTFTTFIGLVLARDWNGAADDLVQTRYATEVGPRAQRICDKLRSG